jgi:hypothetical protein
MKEQKLYNEGNYDRCLEELYKKKKKVKVAVWGLIIFSYLLDILFYILLKVFEKEIESGNISTLIILLGAFAVAVAGAVAFAFAVAFAGAFAVAVAGAGAFAFAGAVAVAGAGAFVVAGAFAVAFAFAVAVAFAGAVAVAGSLIKLLCKWGLK